MMGWPMNNSVPVQYREWRRLYSLLAVRTDVHMSVSHSLVPEAARRLDSSVEITRWKTVQVQYLSFKWYWVLCERKLPVCLLAQVRSQEELKFRVELYGQSSFWKAESSLDNQKAPRLLYNPKVNYYVRKNQPLVPIMSQKDPVHTHTPYFF
jgi:hypothetical protein